MIDKINATSWQMKKVILLSVVVLLGINNTRSFAQTRFWNSPDAYLGQKPPGDTPKVFAKHLLTRQDTFPMARVAFSKDGKEFYYPTNTSWTSGKHAKIRYFTYEDKKWKGPFILNEHYNAPTFSMDGQTLYFAGGKGDGVHAFVWRSQRKPGGWTEPGEYLKESYGLYNFMPTLSGKCYVGSNANQGSLNDYNSYDICELTLAAKDTMIRSLGTPLNTPGFDGDFYIDPDESYIIVSAKETKDFQSELYISFRKADHTWTTLKSLGPLINDGLAHRFGQYVTPDNKYLFYTRGTSEKDCAIYWVRFDRLLKHLKHINPEL